MGERDGSSMGSGSGAERPGTAPMNRPEQSITLPPRARRRNLSESAYLNDLEAARRWKREHREQADAHNWRTCACGRRMVHGAEMCRACFREATAASRDERARRIEAWWAQGLSLKAIGERLGWARGTVGSELDWMRRHGYSVPHRYRSYGGEPRDGSEAPLTRRTGRPDSIEEHTPHPETPAPSPSEAQSQ